MQPQEMTRGPIRQETSISGGACISRAVCLKYTLCVLPASFGSKIHEGNDASRALVAAGRRHTSALFVDCYLEFVVEFNRACFDGGPLR